MTAGTHNGGSRNTIAAIMRVQGTLGLVITIAMFIIAGCATAAHQGWTKAGAGPEDLARDRYTCIQESRVPYGTSYGSATTTAAGWGSQTSAAQGGSDVGFILLGATRRTQSEANRLFDACMEARGWRAGN